jgi:hypothetical protein
LISLIPALSACDFFRKLLFTKFAAMLSYSFLLLVFELFSNPPADPKFEAQVIDDQVSIGYGLAIGDVDGDKKPDILLADKKQFVWYRNGDWKRFVMVENLTASDNVCIAARDIDGDGKVEVAVGAQWNPSETSDTLKSGSVHYLIRPDDPTSLWTPVELHHEPVIHRMRWVKTSANKFQLVVLPLHGRGNKDGQGNGVKVIAYEKPKDPKSKWTMRVIDESMHLTHNLDVVPQGNSESIYIGGKEGVKVFAFDGKKWSAPKGAEWLVRNNSFGEVRSAGKEFLAAIEPMHGNELTVYIRKEGNREAQPELNRVSLTSGLNQGHALATADLLGVGFNQVVAGWREPDKENKVGIKIFVADTPQGKGWKDYWIDDNGMACEDLQIADLNGDGKKDIVASGRATHNLKIYWNKQ